MHVATWEDDQLTKFPSNPGEGMKEQKWDRCQSCYLMHYWEASGYHDLNALEKVLQKQNKRIQTI